MGFPDVPRVARSFLPTLVAACLAAGLADPAWAEDLPFAQPEEVGLSSERLDRLDAAMQAAVDEKRVAGVVTLVVREGRVAHYRAFGDADIRSRRSMQRDDIFRLYSMTKPVVSVALLMLYEEGKFQLDDPLEMYIPEFKDLKVFVRLDEAGREIVEEARRKPTVRDALRHTVGLSSGNGQGYVHERYRELGIQISRLPSLKEQMRLLGQVPLLYHPGEQWVYGLGHDVQAYLVEYFSGMGVDEFLEQRLFQPLGMETAAYGIPDEFAARFPTIYQPSGDGGLKEGEDYQTIITTTGLYEGFNNRPFGTAGLSSTIMDYARFSQMLLNGGSLEGVRILSPKTVEMMTQNQLPEGVSTTISSSWAAHRTGYGLGLSVSSHAADEGNLTSPGAFGWLGAGTTRFLVDPEEGLVAVIMAQQTPSDGRLMRDFQTLVYQAIVDQD